MGADDLGMLKEGVEETLEDNLRRQLLEKERENDKLRTQVQSLQTQLSQRPPLEEVQELQKEYRNLELILEGTMKENKRAMDELQKGKDRERLLEKELTKIAGDNWQSNLEIPAMATPFAPRTAASFFQQPDAAPAAPKEGASAAQIEQVRLLILGMEQRMAAREEALKKEIARAEEEGKNFKELGRQVMSAK
ncbi:unnamed protein product [Peniophora sp. CBMAI 1063]|nr:unnamed protein product [Peniophora sp. CBMAI 1063]